MGTVSCHPKKSQSVDRLLETLSARMRREVVHYFETVAVEPTATLDEVVDHLEPRVTDSRVSLSTRLRHVHLPKLEERGWLDYDRRSGDIHYHGHDAADRLLSDVCDVFHE